MAYTKRTCHKCGYRDIQPNMKQIEVEYTTGSSQAALSGRAVATSMLFGSKKGGNQVANWFTGNTKRQYKRKKLVWVCYSNCGNHKPYVESKPTRKITKAEKIENKADAIERLAASKARIEELKLEERSLYTWFDWFLHYSWQTIKITFWLFVALIGIVIMFK